MEVGQVNDRRLELLRAGSATAPHGGGVIVIDDSGERKDGTATAHVAGSGWAGRARRTTVLVQCSKVDVMGVEPVQEVQRLADAAADVLGRGGGVEASCGLAAGSSEQHPGGERAYEAAVVRRLVGEPAVEPDGDAFEVVVAGRQDAGGDPDDGRGQG
ncbi:hypothetical protein [Streptomyces sp. NPDC005827]|uniref:hypothetical protein n=1 Tax=Streptomyces sp. NPDC005827 TaxID=3157070 RepID=UPI0033DE6BDA